MSCALALALATVAHVAYGAAAPDGLDAALDAAGDSRTASDDCALCHAEMAQMVADSLHGALGCLACHAPHGSPALTPDERVAKCASCHLDDLGEDYHVVGEPYRDPLADATLTCTSSCHDPHDGRYDYMLGEQYDDGAYQQDGFCLRCHPDIGVTR